MTPDDAPFRPRRGRVVPQVVAVVFVLVFAGVAVGLTAAGQWNGTDAVALVGFGLLVAAFVWRYSAIRAVPGPDGLAVRNLVLGRTVAWEEIEAVRFVDGDPWVTLQLDDGDDLAVMAIQRVDAEHGRSEADRLRRLVTSARARGRGPRPSARPE